MKIDYDRFDEELNNEATRAEFENFINSLEAVTYSLKRNEHNEYSNPAVYHMWTGYCIARHSRASSSKQ
jgi:hypothetical protein